MEMQAETQRTYPGAFIEKRNLVIGGKTKEEFLQSLDNASVKMNSYAEQIFASAKFIPLESAKELQVVEVTLAQLGFSTKPTIGQIIEKAKPLGLNLCPLETAICLRLQYMDQPIGKWVVVASDKIVEEQEFPRGFYLRRMDDGLWLRGYKVDDDHLWDLDDHFVFIDNNKGT